LKILDDEQMSRDLRLMDRSPGDRITNEIARDVCVREREKAFSSIFRHGLFRNFDAAGASNNISLKCSKIWERWHLPRAIRNPFCRTPTF
jgi:hypothetical protein